MIFVCSATHKTKVCACCFIAILRNCWEVYLLEKESFFVIPENVFILKGGHYGYFKDMYIYSFKQYYK